ncbi:MAG: hypothetical protein WCB46_07035 [Methanoregula sp.]
MSETVPEQFGNEIAPFRTSITLHFPAGHPPPALLVSRIVKARVEEMQFLQAGKTTAYRPRVENFTGKPGRGKRL